MAARLKVAVCLLNIILFTFSVPASAWLEEGTQYGNEFTSTEKITLDYATFLKPNVKYIQDDAGRTFNVYCYINMPKSVLQIWRSVQVVLLHAPLEFKCYPGGNESEVYENYESKSSWPSSFIFTSSDSIIDFPAFDDYCVGIYTREKYSFHLKVRRINFWKVLQTLLGVFLFLTASTLSRNYFFHYASGVTLGVLASFLVLLYFASRFIPQKSASYAVLVFGYSFVFYFLNLVWYHLHDVLAQYMDFVLAYCAIAAFVSFVICYRLGPVNSERTHNLIQWSIQALSLVLIFFSSEYREVSTASILVLISVQVIPIQWIKWVKYLWYRCFPPKVKLLTELEYIEQGHAETKKALEDLKQFCSSPECRVWTVVRNLKDPVRFATFIEDGSHVTDQELLDYNSEDIDIDDLTEEDELVRENTLTDSD